MYPGLQVQITDPLELGGWDVRASTGLGGAKLESSQVPPALTSLQVLLPHRSGPISPESQPVSANTAAKMASFVIPTSLPRLLELGGWDVELKRDQPRVGPMDRRGQPALERR